MKINEFIEMVNQNKSKFLKAEQVQAFVKKELEVKEYLSIKSKKQLVQSVANECMFYEDGVFKFDDIQKYICFTMRTIATYTNLELSDDIENDYDMLCEAKMLNAVIEAFNGEYENVKVLFQMQCDYILSGNTIEAQLGRFLEGVSDKLDVLVNALAEKVDGFNLNDLPIKQDDLNKIIQFVNLQK